MLLDDPKQPEFASWKSYPEFARRVRHGRRYVWQEDIQAFLFTVLATLKDRDVKIKKDTILFRAQHGVECRTDTDESGHEIDGQVFGLGSERMKPRKDRAEEGRINPAGISVLYLASLKETAIAEIRPWLGSEVSLSQFKILRDLKAVNLSLSHRQISIGGLLCSQLTGEEAPDAETKLKAVWTDIDSAFSRPVRLTDDLADYVPTQILSELFRDAGYDAVIYRSQFGKKGYNIAIFNVDHADPINCTPFEIAKIEVSTEQIGNRWSSQRHLDSKKK